MKVCNILAVLVVMLLVGCGKPTDIVFGPEPLKQMAEQGDKFKQLSEEDRMLLASYLGISAMSKVFGADVKSATGRTVGEVLKDARAWRDKMKAADAEQAALRAKVETEEKAISAKIAQSATVAVTSMRVLPKNYDAGRYSELLMLNFAVENKGEKPIRQLKGWAEFFDATGDKVGRLAIEIDQLIPSGQTVKTDTGMGWKLNSFMNSDIEKIASREFDSMKVRFQPVSVAFEGGEVLRTPGSR